MCAKMVNKRRAEEWSGSTMVIICISPVGRWGGVGPFLTGVRRRVYLLACSLGKKEPGYGKAFPIIPTAD